MFKSKKRGLATSNVERSVSRRQRTSTIRSIQAVARKMEGLESKKANYQQKLEKADLGRAQKELFKARVRDCDAELSRCKVELDHYVIKQNKAAEKNVNVAKARFNGR